MRKLKIYLDTSIISYLQQEDSPKETEITQKLWNEIKMGKHDAYISETVLLEIYNCPEPKQAFLLQQIAEVNLKVLDIHEDIKILAQKYVTENIIPKKYLDDATHIAMATYYICDFIVSWNFKHIVRGKTIIGVNGINKLMGYREIGLISPQSIIEEEEWL